MATETPTTPTEPKAKATPAAPHACECGCGGMIVPAKTRFLVGHDAKLKSQLINTALGTDKAEAAKATARIEKLGWTGHLDASRKSRSDKAEAKAKREREAADKAHAVEAEKAKAKAEKAAKATEAAAKS